MKDNDFIELEKTIRKMMNIGTKEWKRHIKFNFTRTEAMVLYKLNNEGPQRASQLAKSLYITTGGLTGITDKLVTKGYMTRKRDEADRRVVYLDLTEKGRETLQTMYVSRRKFIDTVFLGLSEEEMEQLLTISKKMLANLEAAEKKSNS